MGQQSVGKSFALNHLVDTSFAGSAMRTTGTLYCLHIIWDRVYMYRGCMVISDAYR
jgi:GTPase SAR1 family protein